MARDRTTNLVTRLLVRQEEFNRKLGSAERRMKRFNSKMTQLGRQFQRMIAVTFGTTAILNFSRNTLDIIKRTDSLNRALRAISGTSEQFAQSQKFLSEVAENTGTEMLSLTKSYVKFTAATKGTTLEGEKADTVFRKLTKSAGVLGLSMADTEGILFAIQQMISKGTVSSEELKRQLGDRLPGAFRIMAEAIGVTQAQLLKLLKSGSLLTEDVLPRFADQVEKAYGSDQIEKVETLVAAQNRLTNAWREFIAQVDSGEGKISQAFKEITGGAISLINILKAVEDGSVSLGEAYLALQSPAALLALNQKVLLNQGIEAKRAVEQEAQALKTFEKAQKNGIKTSSEFLLFHKKISEQLGIQFEKTDMVIRVMALFDKAHKDASDAAKEHTETIDQFIKRMDSAEMKLKRFLDTISFASDSVSTDELRDALRSAVPEDQRFDDFDFGFPDPEIVEEYFEEIVTLADTGWVRIQEVWGNGQKEMTQLVIDQGAIFQDTLNSIFDNIASGGKIDQIFAGIFELFGKNMQRLGGAMLAIGFGLKSVKKALLSLNGPLAIAAGAGLLAAGTVLRSAASSFAGAIGGGAGASGSGGGFRGSSTGQTIVLKGRLRIAGKDLDYVLDQRSNDSGRLRGG